MQNLRSLCTFALLGGAGLTHAATLAYQGMEPDMADRGFHAVFSIYEADSILTPSSVRTLVWTERFLRPIDASGVAGVAPIVADRNGLYSIVLGQTTPIPGSPAAGKRFYLRAVLADTLGGAWERLHLSSAPGDCHLTWALDIVPHSETTLDASRLGGTNFNDPSNGFASMSGMGGLVGTAPALGSTAAPIAAAAATTATAPSASPTEGLRSCTEDAQVGGTIGGTTGALGQAATQIAVAVNPADISATAAGHAASTSPQLQETVISAVEPPVVTIVPIDPEVIIVPVDPVVTIVPINR